METVSLVRKLRIFILLTLILCLSNSAVADHDTDNPLTLEQCITLALENNPDLKYSTDQLMSAAEKIAKARRRYLPTMNLSVSDNTSLDDSSDFSQYDPETGQSFVPGEGFQVSADVSYTIYDSNNRSAQLNSALDSQGLIELDSQQITRDLIIDTIRTYLAVLEKKAESTVRKEQVVQAEEALKVAQMRLNEGSGIQYEVLLEEAYLAQSQADLLTAENDVKQAKRSLLYLMRKETSEDVQLSDLEDTKELEYREDDLMEIASNNRLEFKRYLTEIHSSEMQLKLLKASRRPKLDFILSYDQQGTGIDTVGDGDIIWSAGLSFRFSPFKDTSVYASSNREWINSDQFMQKSSLFMSLNDDSSVFSQEIDQRIMIRKLRSELATLEDSIRVEVFAAYEDFMESCVLLSAREKNLVAMEENHRIQVKSYELGINQYKDVVDARTDLISARINLTRARYTSEQLRRSLEYALGLLSFEESVQ